MIKSCIHRHRPTSRRTRQRLLSTIVSLPISLGYAALNGRLGAMLHRGELVRTGTFLLSLGIELSDGQQSWYGRHVVKAYRAANHGEPLKLWTQHRTTSRWIQVFVYQPSDTSLVTALATYKPAAQALAIRASLAEAAQTNRRQVRRPTENEALANLRPRRMPTKTALYADLATTHSRSDREGFGLVGHMLLRALLGKVGEQL